MPLERFIWEKRSQRLPGGSLVFWRLHISRFRAPEVVCSVTVAQSRAVWTSCSLACWLASLARGLGLFRESKEFKCGKSWCLPAKLIMVEFVRAWGESLDDFTPCNSYVCTLMDSRDHGGTQNHSQRPWFIVTLHLWASLLLSPSSSPGPLALCRPSSLLGLCLARSRSLCFSSGTAERQGRQLSLIFPGTFLQLIDI